jgi:cell division protein ZapE
VNSEPKTVSARLSDEVAARRLEFDVTQQAAAARLTALGDELRRPPALLRTLRLRAPWLSFGAAVAVRRGLYLWGGVGRGKTLLMDWFFASLQMPRAERWHFYRFMRGVHAELGSVQGRARPLEWVARSIAERTNVICLDEFFVADIADAMILAGLFAGLFRRGVTLIATSNHAPQDLYKDGLQRQRLVPTIALIESHTEVLHLDSGIDYRLRQLERAPTYIDANLPDTPAALEARFAALAGGSTAGPGTLSIEGRALHAIGTGPGMAWFDFSELCEGPRSQNDYIELARRYSTLFIANIPEFTHRHEDAARRFVMLIDELYDRGVKIVVSAAAAPAALYRGERLQIDFRRAASRLIDMQTQRYLAGAHRA